MQVTLPDGRVITPSIYQSAVLDWFGNGRGSLIVNAVAGSGKTTLIMMCLPLVSELRHVQVFAFNTEIARELNKRLDMLRTALNRPFRSVRCSTFHSVGAGAVAYRLGCKVRDLNTDGGKLRHICAEWLSDDDQQMYSDFICRLTSFAKGIGLGILVPDTDQEWFNLIRHHDLYLDHDLANEGQAIAYARQLLEKSNAEAKNHRWIDFDDMLYLPLLWRCRLWQNDWVIVDEAQDTNPVRRALAKLALRPGGRSMWVGDPKQAIYGFTGASHDAMEIVRREFKAEELPLSVSYRCPKLVAAKVKHIVPQFEVPDSAAAGVEEAWTLEEAAKKMGEHDAIVCRNTAPLISAAYSLIAMKKPCVVLGREIGQGLIALIRRMKTDNIDSLQRKLKVFGERETAKFMAVGEEGKAEAINDRIACINVIIAHLDEPPTVRKLTDAIESMFSDTNGKLTLATIHKVKGKEYRVLAVLEPSLSPSPWARQDWQYEQEMNLIYVRDTRCQETYVTIVAGKVPKKEKAA